MLPIQRSTPAEGSVGGVGGRIHDYLEAAGHGDDEQGPLFRPIRNNRTGRIDKALVAKGRHRGAVRHVEKTRGPTAAFTNLRYRTHAVHARLARKPGIAPTLPCRAQQERAASFPRAGHLHLQTRPANKAGKQGRQTRPANKAALPTAVPRRSSFVPPASTSSSPRSCSGTPPTSPTPSPISVRLNNRCPMHGSPIHRRSARSTSASPAICCGSAPPRPQISAAPSISARREALHDPRLSQSVRPWRCLNNNRRYALKMSGWARRSPKLPVSLLIDAYQHGRILLVVYTMRGSEVRRIISARTASRRERADYTLQPRN